MLEQCLGRCNGDCNLSCGRTCVTGVVDCQDFPLRRILPVDTYVFPFSFVMHNGEHAH